MNSNAPPQWLSKEYFQVLLCEYESDVRNIRDFQLEAAIPPGRNFTSIIWRANITLDMKDNSLKNRSYIVKVELPNEKGGDLVAKLDMFPKEMIMYTKYLPEFELLYENIGWNIQFAPKCFCHPNAEGDKQRLVFEDLKPQGFTNPDRFSGCSMEQMRYILMKLAEFHAASAVYVERYDHFPREFESGFVNPEHGYEFHKRIYNLRSQSFKRGMATWNFHNIDEYIKKFPTFEQYWKCCRSTLKPDNSFNVLNHGDFWSGNIMFAYDKSGSIDQLLFLDFQTCKWGSPAEDLLFFLTLSPALDIRIKAFDQFVAIYHGRLIECLRALDYGQPLPKLRDLHKAMLDQKNTFYAFFAIFNHMAPLLMNSEMEANLENLHRDDKVGEELHLKTLKNPLLRDAMEQLFPFYHNRGLFNFNDYDHDYDHNDHPNDH